MKRTTKTAYAAFIAALDSECAAVGIQPCTHPWAMGGNCYEIQTRGGRYMFKPAEPYGEGRGRIYDVTVFGRFDDEKRAARLVDCNPHSGKWNFHAGEGMTEPACREFATDVVTRILNV